MTRSKSLVNGYKQALSTSVVETKDLVFEKFCPKGCWLLSYYCVMYLMLISLWIWYFKKVVAHLILLVNYGKEELDKLLSHYGSDYSNIYKGATSHQSADPKPDEVLADWDEFKEIMFKRCWLFQSLLDRKIAKETDQGAIAQLIRQLKEYTPIAFFNDVSCDQLCIDLRSGCMYVLKLSLMFPLIVACVKRLFLKMKLIKIRLWNQPGPSSLDSLLQIYT